MNEPTKPQTAGDRLLDAAQGLADYCISKPQFILDIPDEIWVPFGNAIAAYESQPKQDEVLDALERGVKLYESYGLIASRNHGLEPGKWANDSRKILKKHGRNV